MDIDECARALRLDATFNKDFVALALGGRTTEALALARRMAARKLGRIPTRGEMVRLCEASIALADADMARHKANRSEE